MFFFEKARTPLQKTAGTSKTAVIQTTSKGGANNIRDTTTTREMPTAAGVPSTSGMPVGPLIIQQGSDAATARTSVTAGTPATTNWQQQEQHQLLYLHT